jgi:regulator of sigma E protease
VQTREGALLAIFQSALSGPIRLTLQGADGMRREITLTPKLGPNQASQLEALLPALGIDFWSPPAVVGKIADGGAAQIAGLQPGDEILAFDGKPVRDFEELVKLVTPNMNKQVTLSVLRQGQRLEVPLKIQEQTADGRSVGRIGVGPQAVQPPAELNTVEKYNPAVAVARAGQQTWDMSALTLKALWGMVAGKVSVKELTGPITIAEIAGSAARQGFIAFMSMLALISISIGLLNLMPIPVLDGGQVVFQLAELVKGSPVSERMQLISQQIGVVLLMLLMSLAFYNDIARHLS